MNGYTQKYGETSGLYFNLCITPAYTRHAQKKRSDRKELKVDSLHCVSIKGRGQVRCPICRGLSVEYWGVGYLTRINSDKKPLIHTIAKKRPLKNFSKI